MVFSGAGFGQSMSVRESTVPTPTLLVVWE